MDNLIPWGILREICVCEGDKSHVLKNINIASCDAQLGFVADDVVVIPLLLNDRLIVKEQKTLI